MLVTDEILSTVHNLAQTVMIDIISHCSLVQRSPPPPPTSLREKTWTLVRSGNQTVIDESSENRDNSINGNLTNEHLFQVDYPRRCWVELVIHPWLVVGDMLIQLQPPPQQAMESQS